MHSLKVANMWNDRFIIIDSDDNTYEYVDKNILFKYLDILDFDYVNVNQLTYQYKKDNNIYAFSFENCTEMLVQHLSVEELMLKLMINSTNVYDFSYRNNLPKIDNSIENIDKKSRFIYCQVIDNVLNIYTDCYKIIMTRFFMGLLKNSKIRELDFSDFIFPDGLELSYSFPKTIEKVDFSNTSLRNCNYFDNIFKYCEELREVLFNNKEIIKPISIHGMFEGCKNLEYVDIQSFDLTCVEQQIHSIFINSNPKAIVKVNKRYEKALRF